MQENDKLLFEYPFVANKKVMLISCIVTGIGCLLSIYFSATERQPLILIFSSLLLLIFITCILNLRANRTLRVFNKTIEIPQNIRGNKVHSIKYEEIVSVDQITSEGWTNIRIVLQSSRPVLIQETFLKKDDYSELLEHLQKVVSKKTPVYISPVELEKQKKKKLLLTISLIALPIAILFCSRFFTGQLETDEQWEECYKIVSVLLIINFAFYLYNNRQQNEAKALEHKLSFKEAEKRKSKWVLWALSPFLIGIALNIYILRFPHGGNTSLEMLLLYGTASAVCLTFLLVKILPKADDVVTPIEKKVIVGLSFMMLTITCTLLFLVLNVNLDKTIGIEKTSYFTGMTIPDERIHEKCFRLAHWDTGESIVAGDDAFCSFTYPRIREKDKVVLHVKDGFFGVPWISDVIIEKHINIDTFLKDFNNEEELRSLDIEYMAKKHGKNVWDNRAELWRAKCESSQWGYCRLSSYIYTLKGEPSKAYQLVKSGCEENDFMSCYNVFFHANAKNEDLAKAKERILKLCSTDKSADVLMCKAVVQYSTTAKL